VVKIATFAKPQTVIGNCWFCPQERVRLKSRELLIDIFPVFKHNKINRVIFDLETNSVIANSYSIVIIEARQLLDIFDLTD
jgi:hypothetical protein